MLRLIGPVLNAHWTYIGPIRFHCAFLTGTNYYQYSRAKIMGNKKLYAVLLFDHWSEIMDEQPDDNTIYLLRNPRIFTDQTMALNCYVNTICPASTIIEADNKEQLNILIEETKKNYQDENWLETYLYPFL